MKFVNKLKFEKYFDGIFLKNPSKDMRLQEISSRLLARMEEESMTKGGFTYAPNNYEVYINLKDYRNLKTTAQNNLEEYFENYLAKEAQLKGYIFADDLSVNFVSERKSQTQGIKIITGFTHEKTEPAKTTEPEEKNGQDQTKVFEKLDITSPLSVKALSVAATVTVVTGKDEGAKVEFSDTRINMGRRPSNEMVLKDKSASRLHAYIVREKGEHAIYDAQSLNGTYVNGEHITKKVLADGDEIKIGDTIIVYRLS